MSSRARAARTRASHQAAADQPAARHGRRQLTLEQALGLLSLPRRSAVHPETGEEIQAGIGRFGPYMRMGAIYQSLDRDDDVLSLGMNRAMDLLAQDGRACARSAPHPKDKAPVAIRKGRFGPYVQHGKTVANLPRSLMMEEVTLDQAVALLAEKGKQLRPRGAGGRAVAPPPRRSRNPLPRRPPAEANRAGQAARGEGQTRGAEAAGQTAAAGKAPAKKKARAARRRRPARQRGGGSDHKFGVVGAVRIRGGDVTPCDVPGVTQQAARG